MEMEYNLKTFVQLFQALRLSCKNRHVMVCSPFDNSFAIFFLVFKEQFCGKAKVLIHNFRTVLTKRQ